MMNQPATGNQFLMCSDGALRWGLFGAAGVVFCVHDEDDGWTVMLQKRSRMSHEGGTWSCAGGALETVDEDPLDAALREASEEVGTPEGETQLLGQIEFSPADDWTYTTSLVKVDAEFGSSLNFETDAVEWVAPDDVDRYPLHKGFEAAWPHLRRFLETEHDDRD